MRCSLIVCVNAFVVDSNMHVVDKKIYILYLSLDGFTH